MRPDNALTACTLAALLTLAAGCGAGSEDSADPQPGGGGDAASGVCLGGKCDAMNPQNDPANLGFQIEYKLADESMVGVALASELLPYKPPTYYPFTSDGINKRGGSNEPSPAEKFDLAFSGWKPEESFWALDRIEAMHDKEFDPAYYDGLGPVAKWEHEEHGLGRLHDGVDNDGDEKVDFDDDNNEGLESWFGYCNGNTAASLSVPGPRHEAEVGDVKFSKNDVMALLAAVYYDDRATMTGLRCESLHPVKDEHGRFLDEPWYKEEGAGEFGFRTFQILQGPGWVDEEHVGYLVLVTQSDPQQKAIVRLALDEFNAWRKEVKKGEITFDMERWDAVEFSTSASGCRDTNPATLYLAVVNLLGEHNIPFGIDADSGSHVWNYPIYEARIDSQERIDLAAANQLLGIEDTETYPFNADAKGFAHVKLTLLKSHSMSLDFVLELDADDRIVGGEWVGGSKSRHPDFIWVPLGADSTGYNTEGTYMTFGDDQIDGREGSGGKVTYTDAPDMRYSDVRRVLAVSRTEEGETFTAYDGEAADLPANKTTVLEVAVPDEGAVVRDALVYLDATAEQTVGLKVELESPSGTVVHLFDVPSDTREWQPGRFPQGHDLGVLKGVAHSMPLVSEAGELYPGLRRLVDEAATGTWTLRVENAGAGAARLDGWSLWLTSAAE